MAHLAISLLGTFQVTLGGRPQSAFETDKTRALLAFLAVESSRPHRREALATMLWPECSQSAARNSLRQTLYRLRQAIADQQNPTPHLLVSVHDVQINPAAEHWLDVDEFNRLLDSCEAHHPKRDTLCEVCRNRLEATAGLYQGNFLAGFSLPDSPDFETWQLLKQESYHRRILEALGWLGNHFESIGKYEQGAAWAKREIELAPWRESAHRRSMRCLYRSGRRQAALRQFYVCSEILEQELGVEPVAETLKLFKAIRDGTMEHRTKEGERYGGITVTNSSDRKMFRPYHRPFSSFVNFSTELAKLNHHLADTLAGKGKVIFIAGEGGSGKTTLFGEFADKAVRKHSELLVAAGQCDAQFGLGIPYQPFCEILRMFGEDGADRTRFSLIFPPNFPTEYYLQRLSAAMPIFIQVLNELGPDLIGTLISGAALVQRIQESKNLDIGMQKQLLVLSSQQKPTVIETGAPQRVLANPIARTLGQGVLLDQVTRVLQAMSEQYPMILFLDDLQWADVVTVSLLLHMGRQSANSRILIIGAYRPEAIAQSENSELHHLKPVIHELQCQFGDIQIDLDQVNGRDFIKALVEREPNKLSESFLSTLYKHTAGNPLFTVELLRVLQEQGELVRDAAGCWMTRGSLDWSRLPPRTEGLLAERLSRLPAVCREILTAASVQGQEFVAEVVAQVLPYDPAIVIHYLSDTASKKHHLVEALGVEYHEDHQLSRYRFMHTLLQQYLYQELDDVERHLLHKKTAVAMESIYSARMEDHAIELAGHFQAAGATDKAADYLLLASKSVHLQ